MNCRRIEKLIPLYVEGDLEERQEQFVSSHLTGCKECRRLEAEYLDSQRALRRHEPPDFDEAFFDSIRRGTLLEIKKAQSRPPFFRIVIENRKPAFAALALLIFLGVIALYVSRQDAGVAPPQEMAVGNKERDDDLSPEKSPENQKEVTPPDVVKDEPADESNRPRRRRTPHRNQAIPEAELRELIAAQPDVMTEPDFITEGLNAFDPDEFTETESATLKEITTPENTLRIEIQTSDPNIRIIWFAPKKADPNSSTSMTDPRLEVLCLL